MNNILILIFLCLCSCDFIKYDKDKILDDLLFNQFYITKSIKFSHSDYNNGESIDRPYNTKVLLITFSNGYYIEYKIPQRGLSNGVITLQNQKKENLYSLDEVHSLKIEYEINSEKNKNTKTHYSFSYIRNKKRLKYSYALYNLIQASREKYELNDTSASIGLIPGLSLNLTDKCIEDIGKRNDSYIESRITFCHRVDKKCNNITKNTCNKCKFGFYEVVDFSCSQGGSKICGINNCGKKGEPACKRSGISNMNPIMNFCYDGSPAGFCQPGLLTICDGRGILICL